MELTEEQIAFMQGEAPASKFQTWWPLLQAGLIKPNAAPPPVFVCTPKGTEALGGPAIASPDDALYFV